MKTDFLGNELKIGDTVAFMQIGYRGLMKGIITKMSEQKATISHEKTNTYKTESIQFYKQMVKVNISDSSDYAKCKSEIRGGMEPLNDKQNKRVCFKSMIVAIQAVHPVTCEFETDAREVYPKQIKAILKLAEQYDLIEKDPDNKPLDKVIDWQQELARYNEAVEQYLQCPKSAAALQVLIKAHTHVKLLCFY